MSGTPMLDADTARGGLDSLAWLLNNAHNHDSPEWADLVDAARRDRVQAMYAIDRLLQAALGQQEGQVSA